jgi:hypothetical protein
MGSVLGTIKDVVDEMRAGEGEKIGVLGITSYRPFPIDSVRAALQNAQRVVVLEKSLAVGIGGVVSTDVRMAMSGLQLRWTHRRRRTRRTGDHHEILHALFAKAARGELGPPDLSRSRLERGQQATRTRAHDAPFGSGSGKHAARHRRRCRRYWLRRTTMSFQPVHFYQTGTFTVGNRLLAEEERSVQANMERTNSLNSGHRACQGCGEALGARYAIDAAMKAASGRLIAANATGCLEVFSTPYPETSWQIPWIHSLFGNTAAVATGIAAAIKVKRNRRPDGRRARRRPGW